MVYRGGGKFYIDAAAAFGWLHGTAAFELCSSAIATYLRRCGITMLPYIDDGLFILERHSADMQFRFALDLITNLGLPINLDKLCFPGDVVTCLGLVIDIPRNTLSVDSEKLADIAQHCEFCSQKTFLSKRAFQSLLGKLFYINKCVRPARFFMNRMLQLFRSKGHKKIIKLLVDFFADLQWFVRFLTEFNGVTLINKPLVDGCENIHLDACLDGIGAVWEDRCYASRIPTFYDFVPHITHLEMINLVVAMTVWGKFWKNCSVNINCDNIAVVHVANSGRTRDKFLADCARVLWWVCAAFDIKLKVTHVKGIDNTIADTLSRLSSAKPINIDLINELRYTKICRHIDNSHFSLNLDF